MTGTTNLNVRLAEAKGYRALVLDYRTIDASMKTISRLDHFLLFLFGLCFFSVIELVDF